MKKHKHVYDSDGGPCRICRKTVVELIDDSFKIDPGWYERQIEAEERAKEQARKKEHERIGKIKCPSCQSTMKEHITKSDSNGIIGPGYRSWIIDEYYVCKECGTMFKDINKK